MSLIDANESVNAKDIHVHDPLTTKKGTYFPKINLNLSHQKNKFIFAKNSILTIHIEKILLKMRKGVIFGKIITPLIIYSELGVQQAVE